MSSQKRQPGVGGHSRSSGPGTAGVIVCSLVAFVGGLLMGLSQPTHSGQAVRDRSPRERSLAQRAPRIARGPALPRVQTDVSSPLRVGAIAGSETVVGASVLDEPSRSQLQARLSVLTEALEHSERRLASYRRRAYADLRVGISAWLDRDFAAEQFTQHLGEQPVDVTDQVQHALLDLALYQGVEDMQELRANVSAGTVHALGRFLSHWQRQSKLSGRYDYGVRSREIEAILGAPVYSENP